VVTDAERNTFAGVRSRVTPSFGLSGTVLAAPRDTLRLELGAGYTWQAAVPPGTDRNYAAGRAALLYRLHVGPRATMEQALEFLPNFKVGRDYRIASETTVAAPITRGIAMKASYVVRYEGVPEPGFKKTDRILVTGVQVTF
jgi:putative salt-induced outer membrane protein YdiY